MPGHAHELTFSCYRGYRFLERDRVRKWLAEAITKARVKHSFSVWAYVVMPEHVHLLLFPRATEYDMSAVMADIKRPVGQKALAYLQSLPDGDVWLTRLTRQRGKRQERVFWQSGDGYDRNITEPNTLWKVIDYIHNNPVRKQLAQRAVDWRWSSAAWHETGETGPIEVGPVDWRWFHHVNGGWFRCESRGDKAHHSHPSVVRRHTRHFNHSLLVVLSSNTPQRPDNDVRTSSTGTPM